MDIKAFFTGKKEDSNTAHMKNLILMAKSDNYIAKPEVETIFRIGLERGFTKEEVSAFLKEETRKKIHIPEGEKEKLEQLYDLTQVMLADGVIEDDEMEFVTGFANKLGFRKMSSAFIVTKILEGIEQEKNKKEVFKMAKPFMEVKV